MKILKSHAQDNHVA